MDTRKIITHHNYKEAKRIVDKFLNRELKNKNILMLIGPAGSGKTTLRQDALRQKYGNPMDWKDGKMQCIEIMAKQPQNSFFRSKSFASDIHHRMLCPDYRWMRPNHVDKDIFNSYCKNQIESTRKIWAGISYKNTIEDDVWRKIEDLAMLNELQVISIEHADSLCKNHKNLQPADHIQNLMSLNESIGSLLILTSVTNGYQLWDKRSEIFDRMVVVPLLTYDLSVEDDVIYFKKYLKAISDEYEFEPRNLAGMMHVVIATGTGTLIRGIYSLFDRAKNIAEGAGRNKITEDDIYQALPTQAQCENIHEDIALLKAITDPCSPKAIEMLSTKYWGPDAAD